MLIKDVGGLDFFTSKDGCRIKEVIHPASDGTDPGLSLAYAELEPGRSTRPHRLGFLEIYYILEGQCRMRAGDETAEVGPGQAVYIPAGQTQSIKNTGPGTLGFLCLCHPGYDPKEDEVVQRQD